MFREVYEFDATTAAATEEDFWTEMETDIQNFSVVTGDEEQTMVVVDVQTMPN